MAKGEAVQHPADAPVDTPNLEALLEAQDEAARSSSASGLNPLRHRAVVAPINTACDWNMDHVSGGGYAVHDLGFPCSCSSMRICATKGCLYRAAPRHCLEEVATCTYAHAYT